MAGYTWAREMGDKVKECNFCVMPGLIECNDKRYCPDCYSLKIWKKKIENVGKYLDKKEMRENNDKIFNRVIINNNIKLFLQTCWQSMLY
jgi:hypothetical protein